MYIYAFYINFGATPRCAQLSYSCFSETAALISVIYHWKGYCTMCVEVNALCAQCTLLLLRRLRISGLEFAFDSSRDIAPT